MPKPLVYVNPGTTPVVCPDLPISKEGRNQPTIFPPGVPVDLALLGFTEKYLAVCKSFQRAKQWGLLIEHKEGDTKEESSDVG